MGESGQAAEAGRIARREQEIGKLSDLAGRIAHGWAERLGLGKDVVEWVAIDGGSRLAVSALATPPLHWLGGDAGVAFVLAAPGVIGLLFVVRASGGSYWVNVSNSARPADSGERHGVRLERGGDVKRLLEAACALRSPPGGLKRDLVPMNALGLEPRTL